MIVYAVHSGSIHEGGGVDCIYAKKEKAIEYAEAKVMENNERVEEVHEDDFKRWEWKRISETLWQNPVEEIVIFEMEVIE